MRVLEGLAVAIAGKRSLQGRKAGLYVVSDGELGVFVRRGTVGVAVTGVAIGVGGKVGSVVGCKVNLGRVGAGVAIGIGIGMVGAGVAIGIGMVGAGVAIGIGMGGGVVGYGVGAGAKPVTRNDIVVRDELIRSITIPVC